MSAPPGSISAPRDAAEYRGLISVLAEAFLDDPVWTAIGPRWSRRHRALSNRASFWAICHGSRRHGARVRVARDRDGASAPGSGPVVGGTIAFEPGAWPIPAGAAIWQLGWVATAGPLPVLRGLRNDRAMRAAHVSHPHTYLWFIGVAPEFHGRGIGRALMAELHQRAEGIGRPTFLETGTESNVHFYRSLGYEEIGKLTMPSGPAMWKLQRPPPVP